MVAKKMHLPSIKTMRDEGSVDRIVVEQIRKYALGRDGIEILEAGCGRRWPYDLAGLRYTLTGVDINAEALRIRKEEKNDLHRTVLGDLRAVHFDRHHFDIIYSAFVLEHVSQAQLALENFLEWLKPGGLLILKFPDRDSVYGFVTRITPFWFHVFYKRRIVGNPSAGMPGHGPFPTVHEAIIARRKFHEFIRASDLILREEVGFGTLPGLQRAFTSVLSALSLGHLTADYYNLLYILEKRPDAA
jgi:SAM-dependent methyltransferase